MCACVYAYMHTCTYMCIICIFQSVLKCNYYLCMCVVHYMYVCMYVCVVKLGSCAVVTISICLLFVLSHGRTALLNVLSLN